MSGIVVLSGEGRTVQLGGLGVVLKLLSADTGGNFAIVEYLIAPGTLAAPPQRHENEDETTYVLEGNVTVEVGDRIVHASPGTLVFKPRGVFHTFWNQADVPARVLEIISPAGFEKYYGEVELLADLRVPPNDPRRAALSQKYHVEFDRVRVMDLAQRYNLAVPSTPR